MERKHILLVDDLATNLKFAGEVLKEKYELTMAASGEETLEILKEKKPDLILLDIKMPGMDGYETLKLIKANSEYADIPVVFLTGDKGTKSELKGLKMGAMDYIHKPFDAEVMISRIEKILNIQDAKRKLEISAYKDVLTGLWNRVHLEKEVNTIGENNGAGFFVFFDMDNFKNVNDSCGHIVGDELLIKFAESLKSNIKRTDIVCRLAGDEFVVFITGKADMQSFKVKMEKWIKNINSKIGTINNRETKVTVSAGISVMPCDGTDFMTLYNKADKALYHVKQNGKCGFHFYQEQHNYTFCK